MNKRALRLLPIILLSVITIIMVTAFGVNRQNNTTYADTSVENALYFKNIGNEQATVKLVTEGDYTGTLSLKYSLNNEDWFNFIVNDTVITLDKDATAYIKAGSQGNKIESKNNGAYIHFLINNCEAGGSVVIGGDVTTLIKEQGDVKVLTGNCFCYLFSNNASISLLADDFKLPSTTLAGYCYYCMFKNCSALKNVPEDLLPSTSLLTQCYGMMFENCSSLENAPNLPATVIKINSYTKMFHNCVKLSSLAINFTSADSNTNQIIFCDKSCPREIETFKLICPKDFDTTRSDFAIPQDITADMLKVIYLVELKELVVAPTLETTGLYNSQMGYFDVVDGRRVKVYLPEFGVKENVSVTFEEWFLRLSLQFREDVGNKVDVRFISMLDENLSIYAKAGFFFSINGGSVQEIKTIKGYSSFEDDGIEVNITDYSFSTHYFFLIDSSFALANSPEDEATITVTPFVKLLEDGRQLTGSPMTFKISDYFTPTK